MTTKFFTRLVKQGVADIVSARCLAQSLLCAKSSAEMGINMDSIWWEKGRISCKTDSDLPKKAEVLIIGAGMAGILTGYYLKEAGFQVVVVEARYAGSGQTGRTTAKITAQQGDLYHKLMKSAGLKGASVYGRACIEAVNEFERLVEHRKIPCNFVRLPSVLYSMEGEEGVVLEHEACVRAGLKSELRTCTELPFPVKASAVVENQAQFQPIEFLGNLAEELDIIEGVRVLEVHGNQVVTDHGNMEAEKVVFATHFPFLNFPGLYFARMHQERSYVVALRGGTLKLSGMYYGLGQYGMSLRSYEDTLLLGGGGHRTGENPGGKYERLMNQASQYFKDSHVVTQWSAQDCMTLDHLPYVGHFAAGKNNWYVLTGFGKWGMTGSMMGAVLIRDMLAGVKNELEEVLSPQRGLGLSALATLAKEGSKSAQGLFKGRILKNGPVCPHLGCRLEWNPDEKSFDCPCHGSRFDEKGKLLDNPAQVNLNE